MASNNNRPNKFVSDEGGGRSKPMHPHFKKTTKSVTLLGKTKEDTLSYLIEMFGQVLDDEVIYSVGENCGWNVEPCIEGLIQISGDICDPWTSQPSSDLKASHSPQHQHKALNTPIYMKKKPAQYKTPKQAQSASMSSSLTAIKVAYQGYDDDLDDADIIIEGEEEFEEVLCGEHTSSDINEQPLNWQGLQTYHLREVKKVPKQCPVLSTIQDYISNGNKILVIMRGFPGSGKSYLARDIIAKYIGPDLDPNLYIYSTDSYFMRFGKYIFNPDDLPRAHEWNQNRVFERMQQRFSPIIVDNTNTMVWEMKPYAKFAVKFGYAVRILEPTTPWRWKESELVRRNTHGVTRASIHNMIDRYEKVTVDQLLSYCQVSYSKGNVPPQPCSKPISKKTKTSTKKGPTGKPHTDQSQTDSSTLLSNSAKKRDALPSKVDMKTNRSPNASRRHQHSPRSAKMNEKSTELPSSRNTEIEEWSKELPSPRSTEMDEKSSRRPPNIFMPTPPLPQRSVFSQVDNIESDLLKTINKPELTTSSHSQAWPMFDSSEDNVEWQSVDNNISKASIESWPNVSDSGVSSKVIENYVNNIENKTGDFERKCNEIDCSKVIQVPSELVQNAEVEENLADTTTSTECAQDDQSLDHSFSLPSNSISINNVPIATDIKVITEISLKPFGHNVSHDDQQNIANTVSTCTEYVLVCPNNTFIYQKSHENEDLDKHVPLPPTNYMTSEQLVIDDLQDNMSKNMFSSVKEPLENVKAKSDLELSPLKETAVISATLPNSGVEPESTSDDKNEGVRGDELFTIASSHPFFDNDSTIQSAVLKVDDESIKSTVHIGQDKEVERNSVNLSQDQVSLSQKLKRNFFSWFSPNENVLPNSSDKQQKVPESAHNKSAQEHLPSIKQVKDIQLVPDTVHDSAQDNLKLGQISPLHKSDHNLSSFLNISSEKNFDSDQDCEVSKNDLSNEATEASICTANVEKEATDAKDAGDLVKNTTKHVTESASTNDKLVPNCESSMQELSLENNMKFISFNNENSECTEPYVAHISNTWNKCDSQNITEDSLIIDQFPEVCQEVLKSVEFRNDIPDDLELNDTASVTADLSIEDIKIGPEAQINDDVMVEEIIVDDLTKHGRIIQSSVGLSSSVLEDSRNSDLEETSEVMKEGVALNDSKKESPEKQSLMAQTTGGLGRPEITEFTDQSNLLNEIICPNITKIAEFNTHTSKPEEPIAVNDTEKNNSSEQFSVTKNTDVPNDKTATPVNLNEPLEVSDISCQFDDTLTGTLASQNYEYSRAWSNMTPSNLIMEEAMSTVPQASHSSIKVLTQDSETNTSYSDFQLVEQDCAGIQYRTGKSRSIDIGKNNKSDRSVPTVSKLDKGSMTAPEDFDCEQPDFELLVNMFPKIPRDLLKELFEKCHGEMNWTVDLLLESGHAFEPSESLEIRFHNTDDLQVTQQLLEELDLRDMKTSSEKDVECSMNCATDTNQEDSQKLSMSTNNSGNSGCTTVILSPKKNNKKPVSELSLRLKREVEQNIDLKDSSYSEHTLRIKKIRHGHSSSENKMENNFEIPECSREETLPNMNVSTLGVQEVKEVEDCVNQEANVSADYADEDEECVPLTFSVSFIDQLQELFGQLHVPYPDGIAPVVDVPMALAREIYSVIMESQQKQLDMQEKYFEDMIKDEEFARRLQEEEMPPPDFRQIMDMELALELYKAEAARKKNETKDDLATKLSKKKLVELFPTVDPDMLFDVFSAHGNSFQETLEVLEASVSEPEETVRTVMSPEALLQYEKQLMNQAKQESNKQRELFDTKTSLPDNIDIPTVAPTISEEEALKEAQFYRQEANRQYQLRNTYYQKANDAIRNGQKAVASYYAQVGQLYKQNIEKANACAAASFLTAHSMSKGSTTLDLHYLFVVEALQALDIFIDHHISKLVETGKHSQQLFLITGWGNRSLCGQPRIKPAVQKSLSQRGIRYTELNHGQLRIVITKHMPLSNGNSM